MTTGGTTERSRLLTWAMPIGLGLMCILCLGAGVFIYFYSVAAEDEAQVGSTAANNGTPEPGAPSPLAGAQTSPITGTETIGATPVITPTARPTPTPPPTETPVFTGLTQLSDPAAADYASFLILDSAVFMLEDTARQLTSGQMNEEEGELILAALAPVLGLVKDALADPPEADASARVVTAWNEAVIGLTSATELLRGWRQGEKTAEQALTELGPIREQMSNMLEAAEAGYKQQYGFDMSVTREARVADVRPVLLASVMSVLEAEAGDTDADVLQAASVRFSESDIPLTEDLTPALALKYTRHVLMIIPNFADALVKLRELQAESGLFASDYRYRAMVAEMGTVRASSQIIKETTLPASLARTRELLLVALIDCDNAAFYLASGLEDDLPDDFERGLDFLARCRDKLVEPEQGLQAYVEEQGGPPAPGEPAAEPEEIVVNCLEGCPGLQPGCIIKGDVIAASSKVYVLPGDPRYGQVEIEPDNGERWFCTVDEALIAGWLPGVG